MQRYSWQQVQASERLPRLPEIAVRIVELARAEEPDFREIVATLSDIDHRVGEVASSFTIDVGECPSLDRILEDAQATLVHIALQSQVGAILASRQVTAAEEELRLARETCDEVRESAFRDPLTGAFNRSFMDVLLDREMARCRHEGKPLGFLFLDFDDFKQLNDTHGHTVGDQVLGAVAETLKSSIRPSDFVIRYGGDEFPVVLVGVSENAFLRIAQRIREKVAQTRLETDPSMAISCSVGALLYTPVGKDRIPVKRILRESDQAMYQAKREGGDQVAVAKMVGKRLMPFEPAVPENQVVA
jgi:diguanylate cyclase (GGDEF)-like protein